MTRHDKITDRDPKGFGPDEFSVFIPQRVRRPGLAARHVLFAGVAGACALGAGLGLWARPAMSERQAAAAPPAEIAVVPQPPPAARKLQIVVDDRPAPLSAPIDVLPAGAPVKPLIAPQFASEAPTPAAQGFMRVQNVTTTSPIIPAPKPAARKPAPLLVAALLAPKFPAASKPAVTPRAAPKITPVIARAKPAPRAPVHMARVTPPPRPVAKPDRKLELARAASAKAAHKAELVQLAKIGKTAKAAARQQRIQLAKAEARGRAEAHAEAKAIVLAEARDDARKRARLTSLAHAFQRLLPHRPKAPQMEVATLDKHARKTRHELKVERASLKARHVPQAAQPAYRVHAAQVAPQPRSGLMRVSTQRCGSRDPGEALVCADPSLGAAERQLTRAYQGARAAGVSDAQLQRQQQHWIAARSAAAREAPWAVHDVYLARIAELNGLAKEAHGDGY